MIGSALKIGAAGAAALALSGCSLLSTPDPVQLYRFGAVMDAPSQAGERPAPLLVSIRRIEFPDASKDDRILGVTGTETAYIGGARWVSPAETLFDDSLMAAFAARPDQVRVLDRREPGTTPLVLRVIVSSFEARYLNGQEAAPTVVITTSRVGFPAWGCMSTGMPRPSSSTSTEPSLWTDTTMRLPNPASASSMELSTIS